MRALPTAVVAWSALAACGDDGARLRLAPINAGPCGRPDDARTILVTPLGDFFADRIAIAPGAPVALADLPDATRSLAVEILGPTGELEAIGRTAPLQLGALADGDTIPIAMAPPDGLCPAGVLAAPRDRPRLARVADGVLVVGGAELYDPATETSTPVTLPAGFAGAAGVVGAALAPLPDGRAVLIGGVRPGFAIYEPGRGFTAATLLTEVRAHHVAIATGDDEVVVIGGCGVLQEDGRCAPGNARVDARTVDLVTAAIGPGPAVAIARIDGEGALERDADGGLAIVVTGGVDVDGAPVTDAERVHLDGRAPVALPGGGAALARLDSGAYLTAFAPDGALPEPVAAVIVPGDAAPRATGTVGRRAGAALITQDDGAVVALGGGGPAVRYRPSQDDWRLVGDGRVEVGGAPAALRWDDGSVLVFGARDAAGQPTAGVWRFRPRLLGPFAGAIAVVPADRDSDPPLAPLDPTAIDRGAGWALPGAAPSWAIVGGPTGGLLRAELALTVPAAGVAILTGFVDPAHHDDVVLVPGQAAALEEVRGGARTTRCRGSAVPAAGPTSITLELGTTGLRVVAGGAVVLSCALDDRPRGAIGVAARGAPVPIGSISISR